MNPAGETRELTIRGRLDLARTAAAFRVGGADPSVVIRADDVWRATRTPDGPVTLHITCSRNIDGVDGVDVTVDAWGPGAAWATASTHELVGAADDPATFSPDREAVGGALIDRLHRTYAGVRFGRSRSVVEALVPVILEQKVTSVEAHRSYHSMMAALSEPAPVPEGDRAVGAGFPNDLRLRPDPALLAMFGYADLHGFGIERRRAETILAVCRQAAALDAIVTTEVPSDASTLRRRLEQVPGVGPWTSAIVARQACGDPDMVVTGDYHLPTIVAWNLVGERRATDDRMLELLAPFAGQRGRVVQLLAMGGTAPRRRGPGRAIRSISSI